MRKSISFLIFALFLLIGALYATGMTAHSDYTITVITLQFVPYYALGIIMGLGVCLLGNMKDVLMKRAVLLLTIPGFCILFATSFFKDRLLGIKAIDSIPFKTHNIQLDNLRGLRPIYGYITEFLFGFVIAVILYGLFYNLKQKKLKSYFTFKKLDFVLLLVPFVIGYVDFLVNKLYQIHQAYENANFRPLSGGRPNIPLLAHIFYSRMVCTILYFFVVAIFIWFCVKAVKIKPFANITVIALSLIFLLRYYLSYIPVYYDNKIAWFFVTKSEFIIAILAGALFAVALKNLLGTKKLTEEH